MNTYLQSTVFLLKKNREKDSSSIKNQKIKGKQMDTFHKEIYNLKNIKKVLGICFAF